MAVLLGVSCGAAANSGPPLTPTPRMKVVTTTTVLADLSRNVGGDLVEVTSIVPPGADVHSFQTTPSHSVTIGQAKVIVTNGFGLDSFLRPVLASARQSNAVHVVAAAGLDAQPLEEEEFPDEAHEAEDKDAHEHEESAGDPHFWQDPLLTIHYVERIRDGLMQADPANAPAYAANAEQYIQELRELDQEIAQTLGQVPPERRHLVTFHDAYGYFARRYGWKVSAFVPSDASDVTPEAVVQVMDRIREEGIPAVFAEPQFRADVLEQAARDTGVRVGTIYSDALGGEVPTYIEMMRANARSLAENLR